MSIGHFHFRERYRVGKMISLKLKILRPENTCVRVSIANKEVKIYRKMPSVGGAWEGKVRAGGQWARADN